jgi:hypothetical protein
MTGVATRELVCHPQSISEFVRRVHVTLRPLAEDRLASRYVIEGAIARLRIPAPTRPSRAEGLWQHTCCELFISCSGAAYREFNFSPSGRWQHYFFERYREGRALADDAVQPSIAVRLGSESAQLDADVALAPLRGSRAGKVRIGLSAVIEDEDGRLSYWALRHPPGQPDFHHPDGFDLEL